MISTVNISEVEAFVKSLKPDSIITIRNKTEAAYRRGDQLERRRELMNEWNKYIEKSLSKTHANK